MEKFNNTSIFTGYLKQLLTSFNLPKYRVYTKENARYAAKNGKESPEIIETVTIPYKERKEYENGEEKIVYPNNMHYVTYIKDGMLQQFIDGKWVEVGLKDGIKALHVDHYSYGMRILNYTKTLNVKNGVYDSYTHEYLGDYLRFMRDYADVNLMPLYNCFSDRRCDRLSIALSFRSLFKVGEETREETYEADFDTNDTSHKIYMVPVKLFKKYTIALDCAEDVELCCGIYGAYHDGRDKFKELTSLTYERKGGSNFCSPFVYTRLFDLVDSSTDELKIDKTLLADLAQNECDLKLFIKVPSANTSTIVVLEGDYSNWNDRLSAGNSIVSNIYSVAANDGKCYLRYEAGDLPDKEAGWAWRYENKDTDETAVAYTKVENPAVGGSLYENPDGSGPHTITSANYKPRQKETTITNRSVINMESADQDMALELKTPLQLLRFNTGEQHPFADRLIEYLVGNAITSEDEIADNIRRVQKAVRLRTLDNNGYQYVPYTSGAWDAELNYNIYDYINLNNNTYDVNHDVLGFVDKDAEKYYCYKELDKKTGKYYTVSISNTELDEGGR